MLVKIKDVSGLHREIEGNVIVNTSSVDYDRYIKRRDVMKKQSERISVIEQDVSDIKSMLKELINKL
jgi:hypothetical protein